MDVYTALAFMAVIALAVACVVVWMAAGRVGKDGSAFSLQEPGKITLPTTPGR
jgi:hypothetical protein